MEGKLYVSLRSRIDNPLNDFHLPSIAHTDHFPKNTMKKLFDFHNLIEKVKLSYIID